jgi:hypothetical protein
MSTLMSLSSLRLASFALALPLSLVACTDDDGAKDPISTQESALGTSAVEGVVVAMAPITSTSPALIAASFRQSFGGMVSCAAVATDDVSFVTVTFSCTGLLAMTGTLHIERVSPTQLEATADLKVGEIEIEGSVAMTLPALPDSTRTLDAELSIVGPRRMLAAEATASWVTNGSCVTYSASGSIAAEGPRGSGEATLEVDDRTVCH